MTINFLEMYGFSLLVTIFVFSKELTAQQAVTTTKVPESFTAKVDICTLTKEIGPCRASNQRYFYNKDTGACETFIYGGCKGNKNNFQSLEQCQKACKQEVPAVVTTESDVCSLPRETGPCRASKQRYFYNKDSGACETFIYGGCKGNKNNFETLAQCQNECIQQAPTTKVPVAPIEEVDICTLPRETGPCRASKQRYSYNKDTGACETFTYGGCQGNKNNFESMELCQKTCKKEAPSAKVSVVAPKEIDICSLLQETGPCRASKQRYFYNKDTGACETFMYGGCKGNKNNFETLQLCETACKQQGSTTKMSVVVPEDVDVCSQLRETGPCRASKQRYFYNKDSGACETFIYGGCKGNKNNFESLELCETACKQQGPTTKTPVIVPPDVGVCSLNRETGPCRASKQRYFYNKDSRACETFIYGGCKGNKNNFESLELCQKACKQKVQAIKVKEDVKTEENVCSLPKETGPCYAAFQKYFYNKESGACETFIYGGCKGNENNFETLESCQKACKQQVYPCPMIECLTPCKNGFVTNSRGCMTCQCQPGPSSPVKGDDDACSLQKETGPCRARKIRYYFNSQTGKCEKFVYGGCSGNKNNFYTLESCENKCKLEKSKATETDTNETKKTDRREPERDQPVSSVNRKPSTEPKDKDDKLRPVVSADDIVVSMTNKARTVVTDTKTTNTTESKNDNPGQPSVKGINNTQTSGTSTKDEAKTLTNSKDSIQLSTSNKDSTEVPKSNDKETLPTSTSNKDQNLTSMNNKDVTQTSTSNQDQTPTSTSNKDQTPTSTSNKDQTQTSTSNKDQTPTSTSNKNQTPTSTSNKDQTQTSTSNKDQTPTSTSNKNQTPTSTSNKDQTQTSTSNKDKTPTSTSNKDQTPTSTSNKDQTQTSTSNKDQAPTSISNSDKTSTSTSKKDQAPTSTSNKDQTPASTSNKNQAPTSTSNKDLMPTSTSNKDKTSISTSNKDQTETSISNKDQTPTSTSNIDQAPTSTSNKDQTETSTSNKNQTPTSTSNKDLIPMSTSNADQVPTSTSNKDKTQTSTSDKDQTSTSTSDKGQTPSSSQDSAQMSTGNKEQTEISTSNKGATQVLTSSNKVQTDVPESNVKTGADASGHKEEAQESTRNNDQTDQTSNKNETAMASSSIAVEVQEKPTGVIDESKGIGKDNSLLTGAKDETASNSMVQNICNLDKETGPCRARKPRYFYNTTSNQCEKFTYGGCKGNQNNFKTLVECQAACVESGVKVATKRVCPAVRCNTVCMKGYMEDSDGCQTCQCKLPTVGECPRNTKPSIKCPDVILPECNHDDDCPTKMKCCQFGCLRSCVMPERPKQSSGIF